LEPTLVENDRGSVTDLLLKTGLKARDKIFRDVKRSLGISRENRPRFDIMSQEVFKRVDVVFVGLLPENNTHTLLLFVGAHPV
jgi:hypothetical protein